MPRILFAGAIIFALLMSGCKIGGNNSSSSQANLRILNLAALTSTVTSINMSINTTVELTGLTFESISSYASYDSGSADTIQISLADNSAILSNSTYTFNSGTNYTLVVYGSSGQPGTLLIGDFAPSSPNSGYFEIRPAHTAIGSGPLDFYVLPVGTSFTQSGATFADFTITGIPIFQQFLAGSYVLYATQSGSKTIIYQSAPITFNNGDVVTVDLFTVGSGVLVNGYMMYQNSSNTTLLEPSLVSQFKFVNASPTGGSANVVLNNVAVFSNVPFTGVSTYAQTAAGVNNLSIISTTNGASLATTTPNFAGAGDYSTVLVGNPPTTNLLVLQDNNLPPSTGDAKIRFVNASPNAGAVDVQVAFATTVSGLAPTAASTYYNFPQNLLPGYTVTVNLTGTTSTVLTVNAVELTEGATYTFYIMGNSGSLQGILSRDN